jgi:hypothetical protein
MSLKTSSKAHYLRRAATGRSDPVLKLLVPTATQLVVDVHETPLNPASEAFSTDQRWPFQRAIRPPAAMQNVADLHETP